jgi:hypothetical protein
MIALLKHRMDYENMTVADMSRACDVAYSSVRRILNSPDRSVTVAVLEAYADALNMEFEVKLVKKK